MGIVICVDKTGADWAEVRQDGVVMYRGHVNDAQEQALEMLGVEFVYDEIVSGLRIGR